MRNGSKKILTRVIKMNDNFNDKKKDKEIVKIIAVLLVEVLDYCCQKCGRIVVFVDCLSFYVFT